MLTCAGDLLDLVLLLNNLRRASAATEEEKPHDKAENEAKDYPHETSATRHAITRIGRVARSGTIVGAARTRGTAA